MSYAVNGLYYPTVYVRAWHEPKTMIRRVQVWQTDVYPPVAKPDGDWEVSNIIPMKEAIERSIKLTESWVWKD